MARADLPASPVTGAQPQPAPVNAQTGKRPFIVALGAFAIDFVFPGAAGDLPSAGGLVAAMSFAAVGVAAYFVHEHWTFQRVESRSSAKRLSQNLISTAIAASVRVGVIAGLEAVHEPTALPFAGAYIAIGAAASLSVNYLINRYWVFA